MFIDIFLRNEFIRHWHWDLKAWNFMWRSENWFSISTWWLHCFSIGNISIYKRIIKLYLLHLRKWIFFDHVCLQRRCWFLWLSLALCQLYCVVVTHLFLFQNSMFFIYNQCHIDCPHINAILLRKKYLAVKWNSLFYLSFDRIVSLM